MTSPQPDIERIVRDVLTRLGQGASSAHRGGESNSAVRLVIAERLVTLASLEGRLSGVRELSLPAGAVITPAVRDRLKEQNIAVGYRLPASKSSGAVSLVLAAAETSYDPATLARLLAQQGAAVQRLPRNGLSEVIGELVQTLAHGSARGFLFTSQPGVAIVQANRNSAVRAVGGDDLDRVRQSVAATSANLLVIDPAGKSLITLRQMGAALLGV